MIRRLLISLALLGCAVAANADIKTVPFVDLNKYAGTWYQIARNPLFFESSCVCSRQVLTPDADGSIDVYNTCNEYTQSGKLLEIRGHAYDEDPSSHSKFTVDFGLPNKGQYWIIAIGPQYSYAVVTDPTMKSLYILSKTPVLPHNLFEKALREAVAQVDISKLQNTTQAGCAYPAANRTSKAGENLDAPSAPTAPDNPGSMVYKYDFTAKTLQCYGRQVSVFLPKAKLVKKDQAGTGKNFPVVVYGHGQALGLDKYRATLVHLAKKGVAAIFPTYDNGFFDQNWERMGRDYVRLTDCALKQFHELSRDEVVFSGHSKGAYVASIAAGLAVREKLSVHPHAIVLFEAAGFDQSAVSSIDSTMALTVVYADHDDVVSRDISQSIYSSAKTKHKQFIFFRSYANLTADHFWPLTEASFFGGGAPSALHYYGEWKWLTAAALDLNSGDHFTNKYLYGDMAGDKGVIGLQDDITRN